MAAAAGMAWLRSCHAALAGMRAARAGRALRHHAAAAACQRAHQVVSGLVQQQDVGAQQHRARERELHLPAAADLSDELGLRVCESM